MAKLTKAQQQEQEEAKQELLRILKPGQTVYTNLRHVSKSGMSREISLHIVDDDKDVRDITWLVAGALGDKIGPNYGIKIGGCGMDMGFPLVYSLGSRLWPEGTPEPHGTRNGKPDTAGGYALKHVWL